MPRLAPPALVLVCAAAALAACGSDGGGSAGGGDKRGAALGCLRGEKGLPARAVGEDTIQVGHGERGPRIRFFLHGGEAEATQFEGKGEGAEQIGSALLYVRGASEDLLDDVEKCLEEL